MNPHRKLVNRIISPMLLAVLAASFSGCTYFRELRENKGKAGKNVPYEDIAESVLKPKPVKPPKPYDNSPLSIDEIAPDDITGVEKKAVFPERRLPTYAKVKIAEYPDKLIKGIKGPDETVHVTLNLDATSLAEIVPLFKELLGFSYLLDPAVKGAVTMTVDSDMTAREAWAMFEHILWLSGAFASRNNGFIDIQPFAKMPKMQRLLVQHEPLANVEVAFVPIFHVKSAEIIKNLQPFMTDGASITDLTAQNTLLIVEAPPNMPKLRELINRLDDKGEAAWPHICVTCDEVDAEELQGELESLLPVLGFPVTGKGPSGGQIKITSIPRLQTIIASAALPEVLDEVEKWVKVLDRSDSTAREEMFFYDVQHSTAEELSEMLDAFFNTSSTVSTKKASKTKSTSSKARATSGSDKSKSTTTTPKVKTRNKAATSTEEGGDSVFDTPVVVFVDQKANRLTVRTTRRTYALVQAMLERHDLSPRQVLIEANIVEVTLGENTEFGFAYAAQSGKFQWGMDQASGDTWATSPGTWSSGDNVAGLVPGSVTGSPFALGYLNGDSMAFISAVAGKSNTRVLSAPQIMAANGEEAKINIGKSVALKTQDYYSNDDYSNYEYQDVGTILTVTPYISAGNEVKLEVDQEVSSVIEHEDSTNDAPRDLSNKQMNTTLYIPDGATAIMGGLIDTTTSAGHSGIPYLKDIPILGWLFRTNGKSNTRSELLVLITVNVLDTDTDTTELMRRYRAALEEIKDQLHR